jgi:hypothetical protein
MQKEETLRGGKRRVSLIDGEFSGRGIPVVLSVHALINWIIPPLSFSSGRRQQKLPDEMTYFQERR